MATHKLKCYNRFKIPLILKLKTFEVRLNDRKFKKGDILNLIFIDEKTLKPDGDYLNVFVDYILEGNDFGIDKDYVVMSISLIVFYNDSLQKDFAI